MKTALWIVLAGALLACAPHTSLKPLGRGSKNLHLGLGGPMIRAAGAQFPVPNAMVGADVGLSENSNLSAHLHLLPAVYQMAVLDFGSAWFPVRGRGRVPTLGLTPALMFLGSLKSRVPSRFRLVPYISVTASWDLGRKTLFCGLDLAHPLASPDYDSEAPRQLYSPFLGCQWPLGKRTRLCTEIKWSAVNVRSDRLAVDYLAPGRHGAAAVLFSLQRSLP